MASSPGSALCSREHVASPAPNPPGCPACTHPWEAGRRDGNRQDLDPCTPWRLDSFPVAAKTKDHEVEASNSRIYSPLWKPEVRNLRIVSSWGL